MSKRIFILATMSILLLTNQGCDGLLKGSEVNFSTFYTAGDAVDVLKGPKGSSTFGAGVYRLADNGALLLVAGTYNLRMRESHVTIYGLELNGTESLTFPRAVGEAYATGSIFYFRIINLYHQGMLNINSSAQIGAQFTIRGANYPTTTFTLNDGTNILVCLTPGSYTVTSNGITTTVRIFPGTATDYADFPLIPPHPDV